ncbi:MAG: ATPase [Gammaproteobacteria bacterium]|nr:ATPase [Gammaproteobacteria bacterium]
MDDTLKRLLDTELRAGEAVQEAKGKREEITHQSLEEARRAEQRFHARVGELHATSLEKAKVRADQSIAELRRRYDERGKELRQGAEARENDAIEAALSVLLKGIRS